MNLFFYKRSFFIFCIKHTGRLVHLSQIYFLLKINVFQAIYFDYRFLSHSFFLFFPISLPQHPRMVCTTQYQVFKFLKHYEVPVNSSILPSSFALHSSSQTRELMVCFRVCTCVQGFVSLFIQVFFISQRVCVCD